MNYPFLTLFDTLANRPVEFVPLEPGKVRMYVCGPTVYDAAHLGHARCYIVWDVLYRFLTFLGYEVTYVRNVTDVDDKILNKARETGKTPEQVAVENYESFQADMRALNVLDPTREPRATQFIPQMIGAIEALIARGTAYVTPEGTVYYRVASKTDYGKLSKKPLDELKAGARVEVDPHKESPLDFALWKYVPLEEQDRPGHAFDSPWGKGRPGWHIECSAMSHSELGRQIDIHAGGADLIFPHHENEIAQSEAWLNLSGQAPDGCFAKYWLHNGFVNVSGEKMSKSLGNFSTIGKVLDRYDANTIRYFLLTNNYRMPVDFNDEALEGAKNRIAKIHKTLRSGIKRLNLTPASILQLARNPVMSEEKQAIEAIRDFTNSMCDDLNTAKALAVFDRLYGMMNLYFSNPELVSDNREVLINIQPGEQSIYYPSEVERYQYYFSHCLHILYHLGFEFHSLFQDAMLPKDEIRTIYKEMTGQWLEPDRAPEALLAEILRMRKEAKATKNWTQADAIRKHMTDIGLQVLDNKDGTSSLEKDGQEIVRV